MPPNILIVDDEPDLELLIRQRFRRQIRERVYDFAFARDGREALTVIQTGGIDLVLSDINMPVMDGLTLLSHLRDLRPRLGAVIVSAYGDMRNIRTAMNLGAFDFLTKPIDFQDFEITVAKTLRQIEDLRKGDADRERLVAVQRDLQTAAEIQRSFLPPPLPPDAGRGLFTLHADMLPARTIGGDFYDYFLLGDDRLGLVVGDVSGKGVPAALFMAVSRTLLRTLALGGCPPGECLQEVNRQLLLQGDGSSSMFVTLFYGILDPRSGDLLHSNGGHLPPYVLRAGGGLEALPARGRLVGAFEDATYDTRRARLGPGDLLFLYTDGITEARNAANGFFTHRALEAVLKRGEGCPAEALVREVLDEVKRFAGPVPQSDDVTVLALRYAGAGHTAVRPPAGIEGALAVGAEAGMPAGEKGMS